MHPAVQVREVTKSYAEGAAAVRALDRIDLDVYAGEVTFLMGPSGSGKTTLLSIMGCILKPSSGRVIVGGTDVTQMRERELPRVRLSQIGFIFQGFNLFPALTALENVALALDLKGISGREAKSRAADLLSQVGLKEKSYSYPADLSGGQKQRVAIARALAGDPAILLADEPTAALDSTTGRAVIDLLCGLAHERGRAVVIVTHDARIIEFADRTVHMEDGKIAGESAREADTKFISLPASLSAPANHHATIDTDFNRLR
jgi:putative ABC transport system ATP-binding protein